MDEKFNGDFGHIFGWNRGAVFVCQPLPGIDGGVERFVTMSYKSSGDNNDLTISETGFVLVSCDCGADLISNFAHYSHFIFNTVTATSLTAAIDEYASLYRCRRGLFDTYCDHIRVVVNALLGWHRFDLREDAQMKKALAELYVLVHRDAKSGFVPEHTITTLEDFPKHAFELQWSNIKDASDLSLSGQKMKWNRIVGFSKKNLWASQKLKDGFYKCMCPANRSNQPWTESGPGSACCHPKFSSVSSEAK
jgi:hypothetical protein